MQSCKINDSSHYYNEEKKWNIGVQNMFFLYAYADVNVQNFNVKTNAVWSEMKI